MDESKSSPLPPEQLSPKEERLWAVLCHLVAFGFVPPVNVIPPLVIWLFQRERSALVDDQGRESVNFQLTMTIGELVGLLLVPVLCIGLFVLAGLYAFNVIMITMAAVRASEGETWRYPICIRFLK